ncbi:nuclear pore complex protein Nup153 [Thalassophryne amazonica]|uniref:nuclear pore complex protein Nup153 n=1 Tax=Thalassophryne amazonica TaxID=390379 RepID=UPI00147213FE|nr:nuclear pore complex protein Nup153 [Thalassophryne amazonica]
MAATGGGKIRTRRYHIASKPYAKSKQQQSGLISRVTDTVKSIVPSWLQKYFKNGDATEGEVVQSTNQNCQPPPPDDSEEGPPRLDGRDSPEPSTSNAASASHIEPSTSRASLNFQEYVLPRPPLSRTHLNFPPLDTPSSTHRTSSTVFSQPSTSSAPGPFSTGFSLVKEIKDNLSQHEDDNISTTSGFSSRASDKDVPTSKATSVPQLWSPEMERTNSGPQPAQSSLKKPAFNLSVFGTSSNSSLNSSVLNSSQLGDSPFYPGKTTYGGAAAVRTSRKHAGTPYKAPVKRQIKARSTGAQSCGVTSASARRILQSLERMSSPLADARRIPAIDSSPLSASLDDSNLEPSHFQSKKKRLDSALPPVQKLMTPAAAAVSRHRLVSFKASLTPGGAGRSLDWVQRDTPTRRSPQIPEATPGPSQSTIRSSGPLYPFSSTPAPSSASSGGGKMKKEKNSTRLTTKRPEDEEVAEVPALPTISLPLSTSSLPVFSFSTPLPPRTTSITTSNVTPVTPAVETVTEKEPPTASTPPHDVPFVFSSPIVKATTASPPSLSPSAGFTFSDPVAKLGPSVSSGKVSTPKVAATKSSTSKSTEEFEGPFKPAKVLKQGSVLDLLKSPGFTSPAAQSSTCSDVAPQQTSTQSTVPSSVSTSSSSLSSSVGFGTLFKTPAGSWNCEVCLVQNKPSDSKCACCQTPQPSSFSSKSTDSTTNSVGLQSSSSATATTTTGFGSLFSKPSGTWECDTCLVQNKLDAVKCVACDIAKPGMGLKPSLTLPSTFSAVKTVSTPTAPVSTGFLGFGDKLKKSQDSGDCQIYPVENKLKDTNALAVNDAQPVGPAEDSSSSSAPVFGFGDKLKKPEGAWECATCLLQNKAADEQCVACQGAKPEAHVEPKAFGSFALGTSDASTSSTSGGFKFGTTDSPAGFKFGGSFTETSSSSSGDFKFGVSSETNSKDSVSSGFKFNSSTGGFKFGVASNNNDKKLEQPVTGSGFQFGTSSGTVFGIGSSNTENGTSKVGFSCGVSKPDEKPAEASTTSASGAFTLSASSQETHDSVSLSKENTTTVTNTTMNTAVSTRSLFERLTEPTLNPPALPGAATFGSLSAEKEPTAPVFSFGNPEEKKDTAAPPSQPAFLFSAASKDTAATSAPAPLGGFFSKTVAPTDQPRPTFPTGKPVDKNETATSEAPKPSFTFSQSATDSAVAPKPPFSFLVSNPATTSTTSSSSSSSSMTTSKVFGGSSSSISTQAPTPAATGTFIFGPPATAPIDTAPAQTVAFGQSQDSQPAAPPAAAVNSASSQLFVFGASANAAPSFNFGAAAPPAVPSSASSAAPSMFAFNSAPSGGFGSSQTPSFGSAFGSPFTPMSSQTQSFGAKPKSAPVFGQQANSAPVFGAANNATSGGFQFGGAGAFGASNSNPGVFTFGAGAAAPPAPSNNSSIAPQAGAPLGGFNFTKPMFNIGTLKSTTAPATAQLSGRKIKTAVRRRK